MLLTPQFVMLQACLVLPVCCRSRSRAQSICMATHYAQQLLPAYTECDQNPIPRNYDELHSTDYPPDVDAVKRTLRQSTR